MVGINAYKQVSEIDSTLDLSRRVIHSIELYMQDLQNPQLEWPTRIEAGIAAQTLIREMADNLRLDLPKEEQEILIKVFGQLIKNINKSMKGQHNDLTKELAGLRLIRKLIS